jgi:hypothetical protein
MDLMARSGERHSFNGLAFNQLIISGQDIFSYY